MVSRNDQPDGGLATPRGAVDRAATGESARVGGRDAAAAVTGRRATRAGISDPRAARARELHEQAAEAERRAAVLRGERDRLIRLLRTEDEKRWSYGTLARLIGCSRELIAQVARRR